MGKPRSSAPLGEEDQQAVDVLLRLVTTHPVSLDYAWTNTYLGLDPSYGHMAKALEVAEAWLLLDSATAWRNGCAPHALQFEEGAIAAVLQMVGARSCITSRVRAITQRDMKWTRTWLKGDMKPAPNLDVVYCLGAQARGGVDVSERMHLLRAYHIAQIREQVKPKLMQTQYFAPPTALTPADDMLNPVLKATNAFYAKFGIEERVVEGFQPLFSDEGKRRVVPGVDDVPCPDVCYDGTSFASALSYEPCVSKPVGL